jgi:hypothetical protein
MKTVIKASLAALVPLALSIEPSFTATIDPEQPGATQYLSDAFARCGTRICHTELDPLKVGNLGAATAATTAGLQRAFNIQFPGFNYFFGGDLPITFHITNYLAFNTGIAGGAAFRVDILNLPPAPDGSEYHWIQWLNNNYNATGFNPLPDTPKRLGEPENVIDGKFGNPASPFYDVAFDASFPPTFFDRSSRLEPNDAVPVITWNAQLFLTSSPATLGNSTNPVPVTFYNGLEWGWKTTFVTEMSVRMVPGPIAGTGVPGLLALGCLLAWGRRRQKIA